MTATEKIEPIAEPGSETPMAEPTWALVEVKGYRELTGILGEAELAGHKFVTVDVPTVRGSYERFLVEPGSIHMISPLAAETQRILRARVSERFNLSSGESGDDDDDSSEITATPFPFIPDECA